MNIGNCPLCEKIREEKLRVYSFTSKESVLSLCKEHVYELLKIKDMDINFENYNKEECIICSLERKIEDEFLENFEEYDKLCLFHIRKISYRLKKDDWERILNKWISFKDYLNKLIESYDYRRERISTTDFYLILDHLLGTGRRI